ncbi:radical SAM protein [Chloroflexota bacterium]
MAIQTQSGIFIRTDPALGLIAYSPFSGLFYACAHKDEEQLLSWLNKQTSNPPSLLYKQVLGVGWAIDNKEAQYRTPHLLPEATNWPIVPPSYNPILINWLITGNCPLNCRYCYAQDLMYGKCKEPSTEEEIERIVHNILLVDPLVVVLTGGEPLVSPYLEQAIKLLHRKVGIIVDTSGYTLSEKHIQLFRDYGVFVRLSLDSEIPRINDFLRPILNISIKKHGSRSSSNSAVEALFNLIKNDIKVSIQSVATKKNQSDFEYFANTLYKIGVSGWRILLITKTRDNKLQFDKLVGDKISQRRLNDYIYKNLLSKQQKFWTNKMSVQVTNNQNPNAVVLVTPDGAFCTESNISADVGKVLIDEVYPTRPSIESIHNTVNMYAHTARYLNFE